MMDCRVHPQWHLSQPFLGCLCAELSDMAALFQQQARPALIHLYSVNSIVAASLSAIAGLIKGDAN